jgi:AmmeMemoRadiSam system protein B/AmmeMemoRadiSam system protein A
MAGMKTILYIFVMVVSTIIFASETDKQVFVSPLAGRWYSDNAGELTKSIRNWLASVPEANAGNVIALIQPHAGYQYSGAIAAYGVKTISKQIKRVVIIGPSHTTGMDDILSIPGITHISTVLGEIEVDREFVEQLKKYDFCKSITRAHTTEHSVDIQLPLLQMVLSDFKVVPIVVGQLSNSAVKEMTDALLPLLDNHTLVIASSDFTHYGDNYGYVPFPFNEQTGDKLRLLDKEAITAIINMKQDIFSEYLRRTHATICGQSPIKLLLKLLPPNSKGVLLKYDTSGRITGDYQQSVSYASIAFSGQWKTENGPQALSPEPIPILTEEDKVILLDFAGKIIKERLNGNKEPDIEKFINKISPAMLRNMGVFVTLHKNGKLRGCIGEIIPSRPLYQAVAAQSINSACNDWRFTPVTMEELESVDIEISVLTPPEPVASYMDIVPGRDGVILFKDGCSAVFLPQVATEQGWGRDELLDNLALKAGLPANSWRNGAKFKTFQANVFNYKTIKK